MVSSKFVYALIHVTPHWKVLWSLNLRHSAAYEMPFPMLCYFAGIKNFRFWLKTMDYSPWLQANFYLHSYMYMTCMVSTLHAAHQQKVSERNSDMQRTAANLLLSDVIACDKGDSLVLAPHVLSGSLFLAVSDGFDRVFWMGDLNYRVQLEREQADEHIASSDWMVRA